MTAPEGVLSRALDPTDALCLPLRALSEADLEDLRCGRQVRVGQAKQGGGLDSLDQGARVCMVRDGRLHGVWELRGRRLASVATFPDGIVGVRR